MKKMHILIIGGSDPSGGAGIQADLAAIHSLGLSAGCVVTALTAQSEKKFLAFEAASPKNFKQQLDSLNVNPKNCIVKIGMLANVKLVQVLLDWIKNKKPYFVILDPVFQSSTGFDLLDVKGIQLLKKHLHLFQLITPNVTEFEILSGYKINSDDELPLLGEAWQSRLGLHGRVPQLLLKGGHLKNTANDFWINSVGRVKKIEGTRINKIKSTHGTGCSLASFIAGYLALGKSLEQALRLAKKQVRNKITTT